MHFIFLKSTSAGFGAFEKNKVHIFYCADGSFSEVAGVCLTKKHSPDAVHKGTGRVRCIVGVSPESAERTGRSAPDA